MTHRERFARLMSFQPVDRLPTIEWAGWWDKTIDRWHAEGLPAGLTDAFEIRRGFGLDPYQQCWIGSLATGAPAGNVGSPEDYERFLPEMYPPPDAALPAFRAWADAHARGELVVWITLEGYFWFARTLLGVEPHLMAFYDQPELLTRINTDLLAHHHRILDAVLAILRPDFMTFAEDMSYNHGPMISRRQFEQFIAPYYRQIVPRLQEAGTRVFVDTDGDVTELAGWLLDVGVEGLLPLERMAGVDVAALRRRHGRLLMIGAFDKTVMHRGDQAVRAEFERLLPVARQGGFVPAVDHQTPPEVSLEQYRRYVGLLSQYSRKGAPK